MFFSNGAKNRNVCSVTFRISEHITDHNDRRVIEMTVKTKNFKRVLSMTLVFMMILSVFTPLYSSRAGAREIVVHTPTQDINKFYVSLISGITNQGTDDDPQYIISPTDKGYEVRYQIDYSLSGSFDIDSNKVSITVPKHIFKDRT